MKLITYLSQICAHKFKEGWTFMQVMMFRFYILYRSSICSFYQTADDWYKNGIFWRHHNKAFKRKWRNKLIWNNSLRSCDLNKIVLKFYFQINPYCCFLLLDQEWLGQSLTRNVFYAFSWSQALHFSSINISSCLYALYQK